MLSQVGKLVWFNKNLVQHMETWMDQVTPPRTSYTEPDNKRIRLESSLDTEMMASCYWLLKSCSRLQGLRYWAQIFPHLGQQ